MFDRIAFKNSCKRAGVKVADISAHLGINYKTLCLKIEGRLDFWRGEVAAIARFLNLSPLETLVVFFSDREIAPDGK